MSCVPGSAPEGNSGEDRDSPTMPWWRGQPSKVSKSGLRSNGKSNPCILRTDVGDRILKILTTYGPGTILSRKGSPKPIKLDSEVIQCVRGRGSKVYLNGR